MQNNENNIKDYENPLGQTDETEEEVLLTPEEEAAERTKSAAKEVFEWVELFAYSVTIVIVLFTFLCRIAVVSGPSMEKTLYDREVLLVSDLFYEPKQGDVIVFQSNTILDNEAIVKRVIATETSMVRIEDDGTVFVDGRELIEPYVSEKALGECDLEFPYQVPEARYFLMGDHRATSVDSRSSAVGCVGEDQIVGRIVFCVWPLSDFGPVK